MLVTGGAGFIGSHFVRRIFDLHPDYDITVLDALTYAGDIDNFPDRIKESKRFHFWYGNVRNPDIVNELVSQADFVVHFAAESHVARSIFDNAVFFETDVLGTQVVANAVARSKQTRKFVHISTSEVYGTALAEPMTEEHPLAPLTPYASAKAGADRLVYSYWATYGIPAIILRPFNNYGPRQHLEKAIPRFITSAILGEPLTIHGDGGHSRDWLYVKDCCEAIDLAVHATDESLLGQVINIGTGRSATIATLGQRILEEVGRPETLVRHLPDRPGQVSKHISSTDKAKTHLGWQATTTIEAGLTQTIDWYTKNRPWWERQMFMRCVPVKAPDGTVELY